MPELNLGKVVGPQGPQGATGPTGPDGKQGPQGQTGEAGKSAYQAARDGGYTGTEADFNAILAIIERHAGRHKAGGADPLTAADVGAAPAFAGSIKADNLLDWAKTQTASVCAFVQPSNVPDGLPEKGAGYVFVNTSGASGWALIYYGATTNSVYYNVTNAGNWLGWVKLATANSVDSLTAADVGARKATGKKIYTGVDCNTLFTEGSYICRGSSTASAADNVAVNLPNEAGLFSVNVYASIDYIQNGCVQVAYNRDSRTMYIRCLRNNNWSPWAKIATTDYAVSKAGDTMTGVLRFDVSGGLARIGADPTAGYAYIQHYKEDGTAANITVNTERVRFSTKSDPNGSWVHKDVLHTGNKPSGSYTGTGDTTTRLIESSGVGRVVLIYSTQGIVIVSQNGSIFAKNNGTITFSTTVYMTTPADGSFRINTNDVVVNEAGRQYSYQFL